MLGVCLKYEQTNYGSKLQALATVKLLKELGLEYEIIRYNKRTPGFVLKSIPRLFNNVFLHDRFAQIQRKLAFAAHPEVKSQVDYRNSLFSSFDVYFRDNLSEVYGSYAELKKQCPERYDKLLTCSDQLWSPSALGSGFYNLMFAPEDMRKVSWASSFGVSRIPWYQTGRTRRYLNRIQHISMRENQGAEIVRELTGRDVPVLMDPVFAFDKAAWDELVPAEAPEWDDYIFCYFLGENLEHRKAVEQLAKQSGKKIVTLRHLDYYVDADETFGDYAPYDVDPARFLNILRNASCVCTDSFHGTAFSIIFEKPFVVFDRYSNKSSNSKNSRIESVCANLNLNGRRFAGKETISQVMNAPIDYASVAEAAAGYRDHTWNYLRAALCENPLQR